LRSLTEVFDIGKSGRPEMPIRVDEIEDRRGIDIVTRREATA